MKKLNANGTDPALASPSLPAHDEQASKRERILAAGLALFAHEPYQAVTMDRVAEAAGVAKGTLYLYFPSKDALYLGILTDGLESAHRTYQLGADPRSPVSERLRRAIAISIEFYDQRRDLLRLFATEEPRLSEARNRIIQNSRDRGFNFFASLIEEGVRSGVFSPVDPRLATLSILGSIRSVLLYYGAGRPVSQLSRELADMTLKSLAANSPSQFKSVPA